LKKILLIVVFATAAIGADAQQKSSKPKLHRSTVFFFNGEVRHGVITALNDSSIMMTSVEEVKSGVPVEQLRASAIPVREIKLIKARRVGAVRRGVIGGAMVGAIAGIVMGVISNPCDNDPATGTSTNCDEKAPQHAAMNGAWTGAHVGAVLGLLLATGSEKVHLDGDLSKYTEKRARLGLYKIK
jgi:hypothetical protein